MGQAWLMYGRDKQDKWTTPLYTASADKSDIEFHMGRFKHKVFEFALDELDIIKLYLYHGWTRYAKVWFQEDTLKVQFQNSEARAAWKSCKRSKKGNDFDKKYTPLAVSDDWILYFKKNPQDLED
jgi:hypothetical protein